MDPITIELNKPVLQVKDLTVVRSGKVIIENVSLNIKQGEFIGIVGPNGSGKSTLLLSILGVLKSQKGTVKIYDYPPMSRGLNGKIGWVSQAASNLPKEIRITVEELVKLGTFNAKNMLQRMSKIRSKMADDAIEMVGLQDQKNTDVSKLSGGQRQRAVIARALASNADFLLLDEPLVGIDRDAKNSLLKLLDDLCHNQGKTILMVSHDLSAIMQTSHRMIYLEQNIKYDGPADAFPSLEEIAKLRGLKNVHDGHKHSEESE